MSRFVTFTRFNVFDGEDYVAVRPVRTEDGRYVGRTRIGGEVPLTLSMLAITANDAGRIAFNDRKANVHRIAERFVKSAETLGDLLRRNPWENPNATIMRRELKALAKNS